MDTGTGAGPDARAGAGPGAGVEDAWTLGKRQPAVLVSHVALVRWRLVLPVAT